MNEQCEYCKIRKFCSLDEPYDDWSCETYEADYHLENEEDEHPDRGPAEREADLEWSIPVKWFLDYCDSMPEDSQWRVALLWMWHDYCKWRYCKWRMTAPAAGHGGVKKEQQ